MQFYDKNEPKWLKQDNKRDKKLKLFNIRTTIWSVIGLEASHDHESAKHDGRPDGLWDWLKIFFFLKYNFHTKRPTFLTKRCVLWMNKTLCCFKKFGRNYWITVEYRGFGVLYLRTVPDLS